MEHGLALWNGVERAKKEGNVRQGWI